VEIENYTVYVRRPKFAQTIRLDGRADPVAGPHLGTERPARGCRRVTRRGSRQLRCLGANGRAWEFRATTSNGQIWAYRHFCRELGSRLSSHAARDIMRDSTAPVPEPVAIAQQRYRPEAALARLRAWLDRDVNSSREGQSRPGRATRSIDQRVSIRF